ncbi:MAG TPA: GtrA family protein [Candidatus Acidoferrum sp.]|jgi:putative flippase GtrA|nr:GtrA family protein [Candidatus Acidoferrum sp.]
MKFTDSTAARKTPNREGHDFSSEPALSKLSAPKGAAGAILSPPASATGGNWRGTVLRWLKFNAVGAIGIGVQLSVLIALKSGFHLNYLLATALAVEGAVLHNFLWHERYTWADRVQPSWRDSLPRLLRFNLITGAVSIAGNLALMKVMVGLGQVNYLVANGIAIAVCSLVNFLVSDEWVFREKA